MNKFGCLSNQIDQSQRKNLRNKPKQFKTRDQTTIDNLERTDPSAETRNLIARWRDIVEPGVYRMSSCRWKKYHEPRFLRIQRKIIEEQLQIAIRNSQNNPLNQPEGFQPQERRNEQWIMDRFWETDCPLRPQTSTENDNTPPPEQQQWTPMEEGEIGSESEQNPSVLEVPAIKWAKYVGVKSVQYKKWGTHQKWTPLNKITGTWEMPSGKWKNNLQPTYNY